MSIDQDEGVRWLQISAGIGPAECAWVVTRLSEYLCRAAATAGLSARLIEREPGGEGLLKSALLSLEGEAAEAFAAAWQGTVQWIGRSPFRPNHKRKNWFVGVERFAPPPQQRLRPDELRFETTRSSGPGGQNVNKVETAVRVTHLPTGLSVLASEERSQWRNRQLGLARLAALIDARNQAGVDLARSERWLAHHGLERGQARHVFKGPDFERV